MSSNSGTALAMFDSEVAAPAPLLSSVVSALSTDVIPFTGERFVFGSGVEIFYEHYHRYVFANRIVRASDTVLDLGCGIGYGSLLMASKAKKVVAVDVDHDSISLLKALASKVGAGNVQAICGDVLDVPQLVQERIDVVVCHELIEHLPRHAQEKLAQLIASGQPPFHSGTRLLISTPETVEYNRRSQTKNEFHEHEFSEADFKDFLGRYFPKVQMLWQGNVTGNIIASATAPESAVAASFVRWQDPIKLHGVVDSTPLFTGGYMYAIAGQCEHGPVPTSLLIDQAERLALEKLTIAAKELNQQSGVISRLNEDLQRVQGGSEFEQLAHNKVKSLLRECEELGARVFNAEREHAVMKNEHAVMKNECAVVQHELNGRAAECAVSIQRIHDLEASLGSLRAQFDEASRIARTLTEAPLEVKFAIKCMLILPNFIRRIIRRVLAVGAAIVRG